LLQLFSNSLRKFLGIWNWILNRDLACFKIKPPKCKTSYRSISTKNLNNYPWTPKITHKNEKPIKGNKIPKQILRGKTWSQRIKWGQWSPRKSNWWRNSLKNTSRSTHNYGSLCWSNWALRRNWFLDHWSRLRRKIMSLRKIR